MAEFSTYAPGTPSWVDLAWNDHAAATAFYGALFGWEKVEMGPDAGGYGIFQLRGKPVAGLAPKMGEGQPSIWTSYIATDDADATAASITAAGGTLLFGPMQVLNSGKMAVFAAPDGSMAAIWQAQEHLGAGLANEPGAFTWNELQTRDVAAASGFYPKVFGWDAESTDLAGMAYTMFNIAGAPVAGMLALAETVPPEVPSMWLVYFGVANADATIAQATERGAQVFMGPVDSPVGRFAVLIDPEGAAFAVIQLPAAP